MTLKLVSDFERCAKTQQRTTLESDAVVWGVHHERVHLSIFRVSAASGTWSFSPCPLMLPRTSCLRRVRTTSPPRSPRGELLPSCPRPRSSPCSSTPLTGPTAGIRYTQTQNILDASDCTCIIFSCPLHHMTCFISSIDSNWILSGVWFLPASVVLMSLIYLYVSAREMSPDPEISCLSLFD